MLLKRWLAEVKRTGGDSMLLLSMNMGLLIAMSFFTTLLLSVLWKVLMLASDFDLVLFSYLVLSSGLRSPASAGLSIVIYLVCARNISISSKTFYFFYFGSSYFLRFYFFADS